MNGGGDMGANAANRRAAGGKPPVSLCMIVRDEEIFLPDCLASAEDYVSEMIVVDTGSTDRTVQIAESYGAKVVHTVWRDDFAAARNLGLEQAAQPWVLVLDADERIEPAAMAVWDSLLSNAECAGYYVRLCSRIGSIAERRDGLGPSDAFIADAVCRLFRNNPQIRFAGALHEETASSVAALGEGALSYAPLTVWHEGYTAEVVAGKGKRERNARILRAALHQNPADPVLHYAMGTECFTYQNWSGAAAWLEPIAQQLKADSGYASDLLLKLSHACRVLGRHQDAEMWARKGLGELGFADFPDLYEALASALLEQDKSADSLAALEQALKIGRAPGYYSSAPGSGGYRTLYAAGLVCERLYDWETAADYYCWSLARHPGYLPAWERLLLLGAMDSRFRARLVEALTDLQDDGQNQALSAAGEALLERMGDAGFEWVIGNDDGELSTGVREELSAGASVSAGAGVSASVGASAGASDNLIVERLIRLVYGDDCMEQALFWRGLLCVQQGHIVQGRKMWEQLPETDERREIYLYALELRAAGEEAVTAQGGSSALEQALLRVRAWQAWGRLHAANHSEAGGGPAALPPLQWCAVIRAPLGCRAARRIALASGSSAPAQLAAGVLAAAAADWRAAAYSFGGATTAAAAKPWVARAAAAGLAAAFAARGRAAAAAPAHTALRIRAAAMTVPMLQVEAEMGLRAVSALFS